MTDHLPASLQLRLSWGIIESFFFLFPDKNFSVPAGCYYNIIQQIVPELYRIFENIQIKKNIPWFTFRPEIFRDVLIMSQQKLIKALGTLHGQSVQPASQWDYKILSANLKSEIYLLSINRSRASSTKYAKFPTELAGWDWWPPINWYDQSRGNSFINQHLLHHRISSPPHPFRNKISQKQ